MPHVVAVLIRRGDDLLMVRQGAPGEELFWSTPGGQVRLERRHADGSAEAIARLP